MTEMQPVTIKKLNVHEATEGTLECDMEIESLLKTFIITAWRRVGGKLFARGCLGLNKNLLGL